MFDKGEIGALVLGNTSLKQFPELATQAGMFVIEAGKRPLTSAGDLVESGLETGKQVIEGPKDVVEGLFDEVL